MGLQALKQVQNFYVTFITGLLTLVWILEAVKDDDPGLQDMKRKLLELCKDLCMPSTHKEEQVASIPMHSPIHLTLN